MGTWIGHVFPGSCFVLVALYQQIMTLVRLRRNGAHQALFFFHPLRRFKYAEEVFIILLCIGGSWGEVVSAGKKASGDLWLWDKDGNMTRAGNNYHHIATYSALLIACTLSILRQWFQLPRYAIMGTLSFVWYNMYVLFSMHKSNMTGESPFEALEMHMHSLMLVPLALMVVGFLLEAVFPTVLILTLARNTAWLVLGTFFIQTGFEVFHGPFSEHWEFGDRTVMATTALFSFHMQAGIILTFILYFAIASRRRVSNNDEENEIEGYDSLKLRESESFVTPDPEMEYESTGYVGTAA
eukprot:Clim_evm6s69 gene=Clim_evmTU6s69